MTDRLSFRLNHVGISGCERILVLMTLLGVQAEAGERVRSKLNRVGWVHMRVEVKKLEVQYTP